MSPSAVVEDLDVLVDGCGGLVTRRPRAPVEELALERPEEALDDGVVEAVAAVAHAACDSVRAERASVVVARVLRPAVGVGDEARLGQSLPHRHRQRGQDEVRAHVVLHRPADDAPRVEVDDDGEVEPPLPRAHVRDVGRPCAVRRVDDEVAVEHVRFGDHVYRRARAVPRAPSIRAREPSLAHQPRDALSARVKALLAQLHEHARASVRASTLSVRDHDLGAELSITKRVLREPSLLPRVVPATRDTEHAAQQSDVMASLLCADEGELHLLSRAKKAVARSIGHRNTSRNVSAGVRNAKVFRGRSFNSRAISLSSPCVYSARSVPSGKY